MTELDMAELAFNGFVGQWTEGTTDGRRAPLLRRPSELGLVYEDVTFPSMDGGYDRLDQAVLERTGFHLAEQSPAKYASAITVPTLVAQEHDDVMTTPEAVQAVHDAIPVEDKQMHWIHGSTRRFDGYNYFSEHPEVAVDWFDSHVR